MYNALNHIADMMFFNFAEGGQMDLFRDVIEILSCIGFLVMGILSLPKIFESGDKVGPCQHLKKEEQNGQTEFDQL